MTKLLQANPLIISAPFGNYLNFKGFTPTLGTFTYYSRGGILYRIWRCVKTLRYSVTTRSWINQLGLPNPGIEGLRKADVQDKIVSIRGFTPNEWVQLVKAILNKRPIESACAVEFNLSCPNVVEIKHVIDEIKSAVNLAHRENLCVIAKLPPVGYGPVLVNLVADLAVRNYHLCNTIPTPSGGVSGKSLKPFSVDAVRRVREAYNHSELRIIGGGGVTHWQDVEEYRKAGADFVSVASVLLNPFNWRRVKGFTKAR